MPTAPRYPIINPLEIGNTDQLFLMWAGQLGTTHGYVWADSADTAFEVWVEWLDENAPGHIVNVDESDLRRAAADLGIRWREDWPDYDDRKFMRVLESAEADLTAIGHTTLTHGGHIASNEWGFDEILSSTPEYDRVMAYSRYLYMAEYGEEPR